jgi:hypothetical protein
LLAPQQVLHEQRQVISLAAAVEGEWDFFMKIFVK